MVQRILHIAASPRGPQSVSRQVSAEFLSRLFRHHPGAQIIERDVTGPQSLPHLSAETIEAIFTRPQEMTPALQRALRLSDTLVDELVAADIIVISTPMHNFSIPSGLKAWIDHIIRAGRTFSYKTGQAEGLLKGKKAYIVTAKGGTYSEAETRPQDFLAPYLTFILNFIGLTDHHFIDAEGIDMGEDGPAVARRNAETAMDAALSSPLPHAA
jgi:FMN-dependent NADH-azoreductase